MNDSLSIKNQKNSIFSQLGILNILNANIPVDKEQIKSLDISKSFEYANFQDISDFKNALEKWNKNIEDNLENKSGINSAQLEDSNEPLNELLNKLSNNQSFQNVLAKELLKNKDILNKIKKSL